MNKRHSRVVPEDRVTYFSISKLLLPVFVTWAMLLVAGSDSFDTRPSIVKLNNYIEGSSLQDDDETVEGRKIYKNPRNAPSDDCPRDEDAAHRMGRTCLRKCNADSDCLSRKKVCLCDGICGMSCIKPDKECGELVNPMFGFVEVNGRVVGSKARYKCQKVYHLIGSEERICQADGTWSRTPPECRENLYCTDPPHIAHAKHDAPDGQSRFNVNHTLTYSCEDGYITRGFTAAKCFLYNGTMQWFGPEVECIPKSCGDPGDIPNGFKEGNCFDFSCRVTHYCRPGYELVGVPDHICQPDGTWAPKELPTCKGVPVGHFKDVQCPTPENPDNGKVIYTTTSYNSVVTHECDHGFMIVGVPTRRCGPDKQWSGVKPECKEINCGSLGHLPNGWLENIDKGTSLGSTVMFRCFSNTTLEGDHSTVCQSDGTWSKPMPKCLAPCIVPAIENGMVNNTQPREKVDHGFELDVVCNSTFELAFGNAPPTCFNGTWSRYPRCKPARCKELPPRPRHGMVIAPKSEHGMMAKFRCRDGYKLEGNDTTECRFGNWTRKTPECVEIYCPFPGTVPNGRVLLVGNMGMYDYRSYVQKVQNNRQISYVCERGFYLVNGPPGATCVAGRWSPDKLPSCKPDLHPRIQLLRKRRTIKWLDQLDSREQTEGQILKSRRPWQANVTSGSTKDASPEPDPRRFFSKTPIDLDSSEEMDNSQEHLRSLRKTRGAIDIAERKRLRMERREKRRKLRIRKKGLRGRAFAHCEEISEEAYMKVEILRPGRDDNYTYSSGARVKVTCLHGYGLNIGNKTAKCARGRWKPLKPECFNLPCNIPETHHGEFTYNGQPVLHDAIISHGEVVKFSCEPGYNVLGSDTMRCWYGEWAVTGKNPECHPNSCILPEIHHGRYDSGYKQNFSIIHGAVVSFTCDSGWTSTADKIKCHIGHLQPSPPTCIPPATTTTAAPPINVELPEAIKVGNQVAEKKDHALSTTSPIGRTYQDSTKPKDTTHHEDHEETTDCEMLPKIPNTHAFKDGLPLDPNDHKFPHGTNLTIHCILLTRRSHLEDNTIWSLKCEDGHWNGPVLGTCETGDDLVYGNKSCTWTKGDEKVVTFYNDQELTEDVVELPAGSHLISRCIDIGKYQLSEGIIRKCKHGEWTGNTPVCHGLSQLHNFALDKPPTILIRHMRGPIAQSNDGILVVYPATTLHLECLWVRRYGTPRWNVSQTVTEIDPKKKRKKKRKPKAGKKKGDGGVKIDRKYPEGWTTDPTRNRQLEYRLSLYKAKEDDSGTYICTTPAMTQHMITVDVKAVHCPNLVTTHGLHINPNSTKLSTNLQFHCDPGSMLVGPTSIRCKASGNWSAPLPHCEKVRCRPPSPPKNGSVEGEGPFHAGDMVQISCHPNFMMEGPPMIVCQQDGQWSSDTPKCVEACTYPGTIISGTMSSVKFYYGVGNSITYTCSDGFILHGSRQIECLDGARWSGPVPTCLPQP